MEYKASFIKSEAKLGGKIAGLEKELDKKFGATAGVVQLADHIARMFPHRSRGESDESFERKADRGRIKELDLILKNSHTKVEKVTPVLVVWESFLRFPTFAELLNRRLNNLLRRSSVRGGVKIQPLTLIDIDALERMIPNLVVGDFTLEQCVNARTVRDPDYRTVLQSFLSDHFPQYGKREDVGLDAKYREISERVTRNFYGVGFDSLPAANNT